ncbi:MAG: protoheme IX farnesyltransferase, partial [Cyanobacteria bacterium M_surface_7_m2_040]|nr:protoheme IX farnesyltransferase [Cyanobacteria bacterium M_surface_7_m2_040]
ARGVFRWSIFYLFGICLLLLLARTPQASGLQMGELLALLPPLQGL